VSGLKSKLTQSRSVSAMYRVAGSITLSSYFSNSQQRINPWSSGSAIERAARPQKAQLSVRPGTWRAANVASCGADGKAD